MKLTAAHLDRRQAERTQPGPLVDLLLTTGAMSGPHRSTRPLTVSRWKRLLRWLKGTV